MKTLLFNPFERYSERVLIAAGLLAAAIGAIAGVYFDARYDGALDLHFAPGQSLLQVAGDLLVDFAALFLLLYPVAKWLNRKTRAVDILSAVLVAKIPFYALILFNANGTMVRIGGQVLHSTAEQRPYAFAPADIVFTIVFGLLTLLFIVWSVALLWNGFKTAAHAKGAKAVLFFIAALLFAEIISKVAGYYFQLSIDNTPTR